MIGRVPSRASRWWRLAALLVAAATVAAACGNDDGGAQGTTTTAGDGETEVTLVGGGSRLDAVKEAGVLKCGVNDTLPGFGIVDENGNFSGFDIDFCRAVAAGVLGDPDAVEFVPLTAGERFTALQSGSIDVLIRNTTWTAARDGTEGATFLHTTFYDGQGMMVPADSEFTSIDDMANATICVLSGTTTELNLASRFNAAGIPFTPLTFESNDELQPAYVQGQCDGWTSDASQLAAFNATLTEEQGFESRIFEEIFSKEPLGPVVADGDSQWAQAVDWIVLATIQAEEFGITQDNVEGFETDDPNVIRFLGREDPDEGTVFDPGLGLPTDFAVQVIKAVGNYGEIYDRHITPLGIPRGINNLWTNGGLLYAPPYR